MASILDVGLLDFFIPIFIFIFVFVGVYALLNSTGIFGDAKKVSGLNAILALVIALIVTISKPIVNFLVFVLPWFFILILIIVILIFIGKIFGKTDKDIQWAFSYGTRSPAITWIIIFSVLIILVGFMSLGGQELLEENPEYQNTTAVAEPAEGGDITGEAGSTATPEYERNVLATLIHPKVLGMIALLLVGIVAILLITKSGFAPDS